MRNVRIKVNESHLETFFGAALSCDEVGKFDARLSDIVG
jgi:hypothetical protein